jgi:hypothetical protein
MIKIDNNKINLHALWDSVLLSQAEDFNLPLNETSWDKISETAESIKRKYLNSSNLIEEMSQNY